MRTTAKILTTIILTAVLSGTGFAASATAGEQLTKTEFLGKANAICEKRRRKTAAMSAKLQAGSADGRSRSAAVIASYVEQGLPILRRSLAALDALDGPDALDRKVDKVVAAYRAAAVGIEADPRAFFAEPGELLYEPDALAGRIGIDCAGDYYADGVGPPVSRP